MPPNPDIPCTSSTKCWLVGSPRTSSTFRSGMVTPGSADVNAATPSSRAFSMRVHASAATRDSRPSRTCSIAESGRKPKFCWCTVAMSTPPGMKWYIPAIGAHMSRMRSARSFASAVRTRFMPEALSIIEMVMTSDRKHCRYDKVNRFLDQCPRSVQLDDDLAHPGGEGFEQQHDREDH